MNQPPNEPDDALLPAFHGALSLPFERGENGRVAVKIADDWGSSR